LMLFPQRPGRAAEPGCLFAGRKQGL